MPAEDTSRAAASPSRLCPPAEGTVGLFSWRSQEGEGSRGVAPLSRQNAGSDGGKMGNLRRLWGSQEEPGGRSWGQGCCARAERSPLLLAELGAGDPGREVGSG